MSNIQYTQLTFDELLSLVKRAVSNGQLQLLSEILQAHNNLRGPAVACAAKQGHLMLIQELLKNGTISQEYRGQAVINAASEGHLKVVQELLKNKVAITLEDWKCALRCAVENEHLDSVHELAENVPIEGHFKLCWPKRKDDFP